MLLKVAPTTTTDLGEFEAVISTESVDREKDIVSADGMVRALHKWNRPVPLSWNHSTKAEDIVGHVDPQSARNVNGEVVINGNVDLSSAQGGEAWRSFKSGSVGFSFGYLIPDGGSTRRKGGGRNITELDVFEVTATPTPMNNDTRVLSTKAMGMDGVDSDTDPADLLDGLIALAEQFIENEDDPEDVAAMRDIAQRLNALDATEESEDSGKSLRRRADQVALEAVGGDATGHKQQPAAHEKPDLPEGVEWLIDTDELEAARAGDIKAVWTAAFINDLPDSAFLYIEPGGSKDSDGKTTPRSNRHFPYKGSDGSIDLPHLRNALARIPQSNLSQSIKDELTAKAQRILDAQKSIIPTDATDQEPQARSVDPLRQQADAIELEHASNGESLRKSPRPIKAAPPAFKYSVQELRRRAREEMLTALSGIEET
jgi:HK97 family phage prohead protease